MGRGAKSGILVRDAEALDRLSEINTPRRRQDRHSHRGQADDKQSDNFRAFLPKAR